MKIYSDFILSSSTRVIWSSNEIKSFYEDQICMFNNNNQKVQEILVLENIKPAFIKKIHPGGINNQKEYFYKKGLWLTPIEKLNQVQGFSHFESNLMTAKNKVFLCSVSRSKEYGDELKNAWIKNDHKVIGSLLGYPKCCIVSFIKNWQRGIFDPIYQTAISNKSLIIKKESRAISLSSNFLLNIFLRYIGIRLIEHLPCEFDCKESKNLAENYITVCEENKLNINEIIDMLHWNLEWSVLHGIIEITTEKMKIVTSGLPTMQKWSIKYSAR